MELPNPWFSEIEIYNLQGKKILKKTIYCPILENNRENILIIHMIEGENKENKGEKKRFLIAKLNSIT